LQGHLAALLIEVFEAIVVVVAIAHHFTDLRYAAERLGLVE
jgi:hypothetical protein